MSITPVVVLESTTVNADLWEDDIMRTNTGET